MKKHWSQSGTEFRVWYLSINVMRQVSLGWKHTTRASTQALCCCPAVWSTKRRSCGLSEPDGESVPAAGDPAEEQRPQRRRRPSSRESRLGCSLWDAVPTAAGASGSSPSSPRCRLSPAWSLALACETPSPGWLWAARCRCWCDPCAFSPPKVFSTAKGDVDFSQRFNANFEKEKEFLLLTLMWSFSDILKWWREG